MPERLQKILARHGLGSRRDVERWIVEGRIDLNGKTAQVGAQFQQGDRVFVDGKEVTARLKESTAVQVLMYHKPQAQALTRDRVAGDDKETMDSVQAHLPATRGVRWVPLNPMHPGDSGLLLVTSDGALDYALTRRKRWIPTVYMVRVLTPGNAETPPEIPPHVTFDDDTVEFTSVEPAGGEGSNLWYRVELPRADRRAAVRALFESRHLKVSRMTQVGFGNIELPRDLPRMRHRPLTAEQVAGLYELARIKQPEPPAPIDFESAPRKPQSRGSSKNRAPAPDRRKPSRARAAVKKSPRR
ncbi:MAG: hypothetical protein H7Y02_12700 [Candidatus Obscuribacterales bacterium]|nr:hypothetical protein [Steroidobacteraceae bacterium]